MAQGIGKITAQGNGGKHLAIGCTAALAFSMILSLLNLPEVKTGTEQLFAILARQDVPALKSFLISLGVLSPLLAASLMLLNSFVPVISSRLLAILIGMLFGPIWGTALTWSSCMLGAAGEFLPAKTLGRPWIERWVGVDRLRGTNRFFEKYGAYVVLVGRLTPAVPFKALGFGLGLTSIGFLALLGDERGGFIARSSRLFSTGRSGSKSWL